MLDYLQETCLKMENIRWKVCLQIITRFLQKDI